MKLSFIFLALIPSLFAMDEALFYKMLQEPTPQWMIDQIKEDLAPFTSELSTSSLNALFAKRGNDFVLTRVRIQNGELSYEYSDRSREHSVTYLLSAGLEKLNRLIPLPDSDFLFTSIDTLTHLPENVPIFVESKDSDTGILLPDRYAWDGYVPYKTDVMEGNPLYPWFLKIPLLFFRGSDTCRDHGLYFSKWDLAPRVRLVRFSLAHPEIVDARFYWGLHNHAMLEQARQEGMMTEHWFPLRDHPRYKYLVDMDGNCAACPRAAAILHSNSVVFKEVSPSRQWWYRNLIPFVHTIPIEGDLSDLVEKFEWARTHDEECQAISENARQLVLDVLSEERIYQFAYELLCAYSKKQKSL